MSSAGNFHIKSDFCFSVIFRLSDLCPPGILIRTDWKPSVCMFYFFFLLFCWFVVGFLEVLFLFLNWEEMPVKVSVFITLSALACWWSVRWQIEAVKVRLEQFKKLLFLTASCVKCSKCASCILKNLMLNLCFCCINYQLWGFGFGFPPILWPSSCPKYFEDVSLVNSSPVLWLHMFHRTHNLRLCMSL